MQAAAVEVEPAVGRDNLARAGVERADGRRTAVSMPLGIAKIYYDMPQRIAHPLKQHLIDHFNRKRYYEYHSGYRPVPPDHEQYIRQAILRYGWTEPVDFNAYVEDYLW